LLLGIQLIQALYFHELKTYVVLIKQCYLFSRDRLAKHEIATTNELEAIFSNINDLIELTLTLIGSLEDNLEMAEEGKAPAVGTCFEELAEAEDFDVYENYARDILDPRCQRTLEGLLGNLMLWISRYLLENSSIS
jgi:son of sevenless-like protein